MTASPMLKTALLGLLFALASRTACAQSAVPAKEAAPAGVLVKLNDSLDSSYSRAGDKFTATLQADVTLPPHDAAGAFTLPKGTKLTGTVVRNVQQGKAHPHSGLVLLFDSAELKGHKTIPVHAVIHGLLPSHADEIEKIEVGSGDVTDASMRANRVMGSMVDPNVSVKGDATTKKDGESYSSKILGVLLFAAPDGNGSGIVVAAAPGPLHLEKWTRMTVVVTLAPASSTEPVARP